MTEQEARDYVNKRWKELETSMIVERRIEQLLHELLAGFNFAVYIHESIPRPIRSVHVSSTEGVIYNVY